MPDLAYFVITDTILGQVQYLSKARANPVIRQYGWIFKEENGVQFHSRWSACKKGHTSKTNSKGFVQATNDVWFSLKLGLWNFIFYNKVEHLLSITCKAQCKKKSQEWWLASDLLILQTPLYPTAGSEDLSHPIHIRHTKDLCKLAKRNTCKYASFSTKKVEEFKHK